MCEDKTPKREVKLLTGAAQTKHELETAQAKWDETKDDIRNDLEALGIINPSPKRTEAAKPANAPVIMTRDEESGQVTPSDEQDEDILVSLGKAAWKVLTGR